MKLSERWKFAIAGFAFGVVAATGYFYLQEINRKANSSLLVVTHNELQVFHDRSLATLEQHRVLAGDLAGGALADFPNANATPLVGFGKWEDMLEAGEGLVLARHTNRDIENATDSATSDRTVLYLPSPPQPSGQTYQFENGKNAEGVLLFATTQSHAWGYRKVGYPMGGTVRVSLGDSGDYWVEINVDFRYAEYGNFSIGDNRDATGWRDAGQYLIPLHIEAIHFPNEE